MARKRISPDHTLTASERSRRHQEKYASIDAKLDEALSNINWERRNWASSSLLNFIMTYCVGILLDTKPDGKMLDVISQMEKCITTITPTNIEIPRGEGKTTVSECCLLYVLCCCPFHDFALIVSQNARSAANILKDCLRLIIEPDTPFAQDYPEVNLPFALGGNGRKKQTYRGIETAIERNSSQIVFPRIVKDDGSEYKTSNCVLCAKPISSCRGSKYGKKRPTICLIDDIQTAETASNPEQVRKNIDYIKKDIMNLAGQGKKLNLIMTSTPICAEDLCDVLEQDIHWKTIKYKAIIRYPDDMEKNPDNGKWKQYFQIYDSETVENKSHSESLKYYADNKAEMDKGSIVFNNYFSKEDGHISALQKYLEKRHLIGIGAFQCEMQMQPIKTSFAVDISPNKVSSKINGYNEFFIPDDYRYITFGIDINPSYAITVSGIAWKIDTTGIVFYHNIFPITIDSKLPDTAYNQRVYNELEKVCDILKGYNLNPSGVAIDCGGRQWDAVTLFCKQYNGLPVCAFAGRSSTQFQNYMWSRARLKDAIGRTVLCGDGQEHQRSGTGTKYVYFDADYCKHSIQQGFNCVVGDIGSISLYKAPVEAHSEFSIQISNERIKSIQHKQDGRDIYSWLSKEPHDYLDTCAMCRAVLSQLGITSNSFNTNFKKNMNLKRSGKLMMKKKKKLRII